MCKHTKAVLSSTKFPKDVCGIINEFCDHYGLVETRLRINEAIRVGYDEWMQYRYSLGRWREDNEYAYKLTIYRPIGYDDYPYTNTLWKIREVVPSKHMSQKRFIYEYYHDTVQGAEFMDHFHYMEW